MLQQRNELVTFDKYARRVGDQQFADGFVGGVIRTIANRCRFLGFVSEIKTNIYVCIFAFFKGVLFEGCLHLLRSAYASSPAT
jgi:hypothetical protein